MILYVLARSEHEHVFVRLCIRAEQIIEYELGGCPEKKPSNTLATFYSEFLRCLKFDVKTCLPVLPFTHVFRIMGIIFSCKIFPPILLRFNLQGIFFGNYQICEDNLVQNFMEYSVILAEKLELSL